MSFRGVGGGEFHRQQPEIEEMLRAAQASVYPPRNKSHHVLLGNKAAVKQTIVANPDGTVSCVAGEAD